MKTRRASQLLVALVTMTVCGCAMMTADRKAQEEKRQQVVHRMDTAHIFVTTGDIPKSKPYKVLGDLKYSAPFSTVAIDTDQIEARLKAMALEKYPDDADAVIKANSEVDCSGPTMMVVVTGEVIQFDSSADRTLTRNMMDDLVASPK
jgi:hypothetical protein